MLRTAWFKMKMQRQFGIKIQKKKTLCLLIGEHVNKTTKEERKKKEKKRKVCCIVLCLCLCTIYSLKHPGKLHRK